MDGLSHIHDPFRDAFMEACGSTNQQQAVLVSEQMWKAFVSGLNCRGLLSHDDPEVMEHLWLEVVKDGRLFQPQGRPRIHVTFERWRSMMSERLVADNVPALQKLEAFSHHIRFLEQKVSSFDRRNVTNVTREDVCGLLRTVASLHDKGDSMKQEVHRGVERDVYEMMMRSTWRLVGDDRLDEVLADRGGSCNLPSAWQFDHIEAIEKISRQRRPRKLRFLPTRKSGPRGPPLKDDVYGLAQGYNGRHGVCIYRATCQTKEGGAPDGKERELMVVTVPNTAPSFATTAQLNAHLAHRELGLAEGVVHSLGKDWSTREESLYYYEAASGVSLKELLMPARGPRTVIKEDGVLFGYWARGLIRAMSEVQEQCTHTLRNERLGLDNVIVSGKGLKLRLGKLNWGPPVSAFVSEAKPTILARKRMLLRDFACTIQDMLGLNNHSCWHGWFTNVGRVLSDDAVECLKHHQALQGLKLHEGDEIMLELDAHLRHYWDFRVEYDNHEAEAPVELDWRQGATPDSRLDEVKRVRVCGRRPGKGQILCYYDEMDEREGGRSCPLIITFEVDAVAVSPRLKAVLQVCQLASSEEPGFIGAAKELLDSPEWRHKVDQLCLSDLLQNTYFQEPLEDADLDQVICEYEALKNDTEA